MENLRLDSRFAGLLIGLLLVAPVPRAIAESTGGLEDHLPGYSIARALFEEGRLVLEHDGDFLVLRQGDTVPGRPRLKVLELNAKGALLAEAVAGAGALRQAAVPQRMIKITQAPSGSLSVVLLKAELPESEEIDLLEHQMTLTLDENGQTIAAPSMAGPSMGVPAIQAVEDPVVAEPASDGPQGES